MGCTPAGVKKSPQAPVLLGGLVSGFSDAYRYLAGSIDAFETRGSFQQGMVEAGFVEVWGRQMFPPVASLVVVQKPGASA